MKFVHCTTFFLDGSRRLVVNLVQYSSTCTTLNVVCRAVGRGLRSDAEVALAGRYL